MANNSVTIYFKIGYWVTAVRLCYMLKSLVRHNKRLLRKYRKYYSAENKKNIQVDVSRQHYKTLFQTSDTDNNTEDLIDFDKIKSLHKQISPIQAQHSQERLSYEAAIGLEYAVLDHLFYRVFNLQLDASSLNKLKYVNSPSIVLGKFLQYCLDRRERIEEMYSLGVPFSLCEVFDYFILYFEGFFSSGHAELFRESKTFFTDDDLEKYDSKRTHILKKKQVFKAYYIAFRICRQSKGALLNIRDKNINALEEMNCKLDENYQMIVESNKIISSYLITV